MAADRTVRGGFPPGFASIAVNAMPCVTQKISMVGTHIANQKNFVTGGAAMPVRRLGSI